MSAVPATAGTQAAHAPAADADGLELEAAWHDPKRYAWLLGLIVPTLPFLAWGLVHVTGVKACSGSTAPCSSSPSSRCSTS
jgi:hypothetical protein